MNKGHTPVGRLTATLVAGTHALVLAASVAGPLLILIGTFFENGSVSFAAWASIFGSWDRWSVLLTNSGIVVGTAITVASALGILLAGLLVKLDVPGRHVGVGLTLVAAALPLYVVKGAIVSAIGLETLKGSAVTVGLVHALAHLPVVTLVIGVALRAVPSAAEQSALVAGAGTIRTFLHVTLRSATGGVVAATIITLMWASTDYSVSDILIVRTFAEEVYTQYALHGRPQEPALVGLPQMIVLGGLLWSLRRAFLTGDDNDTTVRPTHAFGVSARTRAPLSLLAVLVPLAIVIAPVLAVAHPLWSVSDPSRMAQWFVDELGTSFLLGVTASLITASLAVGLAWKMVRGGRWRMALAAYVVFMLAVPAPVLGIGMIKLLNRDGLPGAIYDSPAILIAAYVFRFLPVAIILLVPAIRAIPSAQESAARVDGCSELGIWLRIIWPQCLRMAFVVALIVFVLSVGELPCSVLVAPPGCVTVGIRFFSLVHYGMYPDAAVLCLLSIASVVAPCVAIILLLRRQLFGR